MQNVKFHDNCLHTLITNESRLLYNYKRKFKPDWYFTYSIQLYLYNRSVQCTLYIYTCTTGVYNVHCTFILIQQEYLMARSDLSNVSSDLSSSENLLDSTDDASFPDTDEVRHLV